MLNIDFDTSRITAKLDKMLERGGADFELDAIEVWRDQAGMRLGFFLIIRAAPRVARKR